MVSLSAAAWGLAMMAFRTPLVQMRSSLRSKMFRVWQYRSRRGCRLPGFNAYTTCGGAGGRWRGLCQIGLDRGHQLLGAVHRTSAWGAAGALLDKQRCRAGQCIRHEHFGAQIGCASGERRWQRPARSSVVEHRA